MQTQETIEDVRRAVREARAAGRTIGLVPTMGALHAGHASLIDAAVADGHFVVVSIFVNPTQFGPNEDFDRYPRTLEADLDLCRRHGAAAVFAPSVAEMYPRAGRTTVHVEGLAAGLCGARRPGHFDGVCTVVTKLFNIVLPDSAYFGQKDAQQAAVLCGMAEDLNSPTRIVVCPTVREDDGLALSSRNRYLSAEERCQARALYGALRLASECIEAGVDNPRQIIGRMEELLASSAPLGRVEYVEIVDPVELTGVERVDRRVLVALAVRFDSARLIDNMLAEPPRSA